MYVHTFGAYFGLSASYFFSIRQAKAEIDAKHSKSEGGYNSQLIAMVGTLFLFMYWPSFNGALAIAYQQQRVIVNTVMAITASCLSAAAVCRMNTGKLNMEVMLNATLAGGVSVGSSSDLVVTASAAMGIGCAAGFISALGFLFLGKFLREKIGLYDTCGVHNLHGLPGVLGGIIGSISATYSEAAFGKDTGSLHNTFPAMLYGRSAAMQGKMQISALFVTLGIAISSGWICGFLASKIGST